MPFAFVLSEGVRSAEPPSNSGIVAARWSSTAPLAERVAISLPLAMNSTRAAAIAFFQSGGNFPSLRRSNSERNSVGALLTRSAQASGLAAPGADLAPLAQQLLWNHERGRLPAENPPRAGDFLFTRRVAMGLLGACLGWEAEADDGLAGDHRRLVSHGACGGNGVANRVGVVAVDLLDVPAAGAEAFDLAVGHREACRSVDRDRIVVPEGDQVAELVVASHRDRF